jgi:hypothetical protein
MQSVINALTNNPLIQNAVGGIAAAVFCTSIGLGIKWWRSRVKICRLRSASGKNTEELLVLYSELFPPDGSNYTEQDVVSFMGEDSAVDCHSRHVPAERIFLIAKIRGEVIGFIWACYYPHRRWAIIPYYGIDKSIKEARLGVGVHLVRQLFKTLQRCEPSCRGVVFEVQKPTLTSNVGERRERLGRIRRFKQVGRELEILIRELDFTYTRPRLSVANDPLATEEELVLLMARVDNTPWTPELSRKRLAGLLQFLYNDCYGDVYPVADPRHAEFHRYLRTRLSEISKSLPESIRLLE